jgi:hypothetical protein
VLTAAATVSHLCAILMCITQKVWQAVFYKARSSGSSGGGMRAAVMAAEAQTASTTSSGNTTAGAAAAAAVGPKRTGSADVCEHMQQFNDHKKVLEGVHEHYPKARYSDPSLRCVDIIAVQPCADVKYRVTTHTQHCVSNWLLGLRCESCTSLLLVHVSWWCFDTLSNAACSLH